jgi:ubiquinone biosynthesis protein
VTGTVQGRRKSAGAPARVFEVLEVRPPQGVVRRFLTTLRHVAGLGAGAFIARVRQRRSDGSGKGARFLMARLAALLLVPFVDRRIRREPFPVQLRRRLEWLGPTYIKLGQILSLREDILPKSVTDELKRLLDQLPAAPLQAIVEIVEKDLGRPIGSMFAWVDETPAASASIGQIHRATTLEGDEVVLKVVKPGIRVTLQRDARLLRLFGWLLQQVIPRYQPRSMIEEFVHYTLREADLVREADNAETFAANFKDQPDIVFPEVFREFSGRDVLTMQFLDGLRPDAPEAQELAPEDRERLTDLGAAAIIRMLYKDGFFHADLHPGNLLILPGPKAGFIDLGMVGRLEDELRRTMLYYYFSLVNGDAESAARYLSAAAQMGRGADPGGFRREVAEIGRRWRRMATFEEYSLAQLVLDSVRQGAAFGMYFPVELVLMVKALVTFEGVGHLLLPGFDVAEVSRKHVRRVLIGQFGPARLVQESVRNAPDVVDALAKMPLLLTEGLRVLERSARRHPENPLAGVRGTLIAGFALVAGAIVLAYGLPWPVWGLLFAIAAVLALRRGA